ncbi:hypothetical protein FGRMN_3213 [Fusarium graminum]|nr:hypothetical protein FGRMN_3213 [Fusarium graminum]
MVRFASLTTLALVPLAQARFDWLYARDTIAQCPPCSVDEVAHTVTVTNPSGPYETVTVSDPKGSYQTVTVTEQGEPGKTVTVTQNYQSPHTKVVYVSHGETFNPPVETVTVTHPGKIVTVTKTETETNEHVVTKVNGYPGNSNGSGYQPSPKTVTISHGEPVPSAASTDYAGGVATKVVGGGGDYKDPEAHTVTAINDGEVKTLTYTDGNYNTVIKTITQDNGHEEVVTVTGRDDYEVVNTVTVDEGGKKIVKTVTAENTNYIVTKTVQDGGKYHTVIIKPEPTTSIITKANGDYITTVIENPQTYTVTASVRYGSATVTDDDCETYTRTAIHTGKPEVEVIVYDPETGDSTCTKEDGSPCSGYTQDPHSDDNDKGHHSNDGDKGQYANPSYTKGQGSNGSYNSNLPVYTKVHTYGNGDTYTEVYGADPTACESVAISTSIATVYNTVVVTVGGSSSQYASPPSASATNGRTAKKARSPLSIRR